MPTPPPPPIQPQNQTSQTTCQWCNKPMESSAINCPGCGKLRKDIFNNKLLSYAFCIPAGLLIGFSFRFFGGNNNNNIDNFYNNGSGSSNSSTGVIMLVAGLILGALGTYF